MSFNEILSVPRAEIEAVIGKFSSGCRTGFAFLHAAPKEDVRAMRHRLLKDEVSRLVSVCGIGGRTRTILLSLAVSSPGKALESIAKDAANIRSENILEEIRSIRTAFSASAFGRVVSPRGMRPRELSPLHFFVRIGKGGIPYLQVWTGFRSEACVSSDVPMSVMRNAVSVKRLHEAAFPDAVTRFAKISLHGKVHAFSIESELRFVVPLAKGERNRYESALAHSGRMNGAAVQFALAPMLHEIVCPLGLELPFEPNLAGALVRDVSPLDTRT